MNVSDAVMQFLAVHGIGDLFLVSGGGIMYLTDALGRAGAPRYWCNYHEQASAIAAEAYARISGRPGVCLVTVGPGATNALSGIAGAWADSVPVIAISGQVRRDLIADHSRWRQLGPQEIDIVSMAKSVTKLAIEVDSVAKVPDALEAGWRAATQGRPGPVWISIPLDIQGAEWTADPPRSPHDGAPAEAGYMGDWPGIDDVIERLRAARRPLILAGSGIHLAGAEISFRAFVRRLGIPVVTTIGGMDLLGEDEPLFMGRFGPTGQRRANFALQNSDLLLCLGTGMSIAAVGFDSASFAPGAARVMVNIDPEEITKPHLRVDIGLAMDVRAFMATLLSRLRATERFDLPTWREACATWRARYPLVTPEYLADADHVNSYYLANALSRVLTPEDIVLTGNSLDATSVFHSFEVKEGQRIVTNENYGAMGWDLPALVGACVAHRGGRVVLITGDGSIQFNSQELLTIAVNHLNALIFVLNNAGYQSIRSTQERFCEGRLVGSDFSSGIANPSFKALAEAYGLRYHQLVSNADVDALLGQLATLQGPVLCEVNVDYAQERIPRVVSRRLEDGTLASGALHDQYPFLPREEVQRNMQISASIEGV